jgi:predicted TIM-barrel fold metal-dependent hydrolase
MTTRTAADVRVGIDHPIVDTDGHVLEVIPLVAEHVDAVAGAAAADRFLAARSSVVRLGERAAAWWGTPRDALDRATAMVPALMHERLPALGIDFAVLYGTLGFGSTRILDPEQRRAVVRGFNAYYADFVDGRSDRFTIPAIIPVQSPEEAIAELDHAIVDLGLKSAVFAGHVARDDGLDLLMLDSAHDYDPLWRRCVELGVAATFHTGAQGIGLRSTRNYMFNHIGHFADGGHATAKALVMGGVTQRFPDLRFAFLEGGVAWAVSLLADIVSHWEKRGGVHIHALAPERLDVERFEALLVEHGGERFAAEAVRRAAAGLEDAAPEQLDDFARLVANSARDIVDAFAPSFFFGCEADDPTVVWAFDRRDAPFDVSLHAMLGSDIGHWDVPDMRTVVAEAGELLDDGRLTADDFEAFAARNAVLLHGGMNASFFDGTAVEGYARRVMDR